jgi:hypothetical protein
VLVRVGGSALCFFVPQQLIKGPAVYSIPVQIHPRPVVFARERERENPPAPPIFARNWQRAQVQDAIWGERDSEREGKEGAFTRLIQLIHSHRRTLPR